MAEERRRRARVPESKNGAAQAPQASTGGGGWLKRGVDIVETAKREQDKQQEKAEKRKAGLGNVLRFRLKKGEQREVVVLDKSLNDVVAFYEHNLKDDKGRWGNFEPCVKEIANCPLCDKVQESYYIMMMTVLDLTGYDRKDQSGKVTEHVPQSRMLLAVKTGGIAKWRQLEQAAIAEKGTMRGMYVVLERGTSDQSANIGEPVILTNGKVFDLLSEEELVAEYGHDKVMTRDGKSVLKEKNADLQPFDYEKLFPKPDPDDLNKRYGGEAGAGSAAETAKAWGEREAGQTQQGRRRAAAPAAPAAPAGGTRTRARAAAPAAAKEEAPVAAAADGEPFTGDED